MSDVQCVFVIGSDTPPELVLFVASIGRSLSRGNEIRFVDEEPEELLQRDENLSRLRIGPAAIEPDRSRLIMCGDADMVSGKAIGNIWRLSVVDGPPPTVRLETESSRFNFPLVMSSSILRRFGRSLPDIPRVLIALDGSDDRRERMVIRTCEEIRMRRWQCTLVCITSDSRTAKRATPDEVYLKPASFEMGALIASSSVVLDAVEGDDPPSRVACLASSVGVPVVTHATGLLARRPDSEVRKVSEWSPDAFADTVIEAVIDAPEDLAWGMEFEAVVDDFGRVIQSA